MSNIKIKFLGAAKNVTGSCYLIETPQARVIVDCGYYQERGLKDRNWDPFPENPKTIDAVVLTHAHLDHCGLLPKFCRDGFEGRIYGTRATTDIAEIVVMDSARIQEEDAKHKRKRHKREGRTGPHPVVPLYTVEDAEAAVRKFTAVEYNDNVHIAGDISASFNDAGHILGSSMIKITAGEGDDQRTIIFSGDIGRPDTPILRDPTRFDDADYVVMESTYGNRTHGPTGDISGDLEKVIEETRKAGGNVIIPSFAIERTQELLYRMSGLLAEDRIAHLNVFVDSPMAIRVTEVFGRHMELFDEDAVAMIKAGNHPCDFPGLKLTRTVDESKAINFAKGPSIIIAGSGMCTGGRVKHHLKSNIGRPESTILFVGYQAVGTLGRIILEGAEEIRIHGQKWPVTARIEKINGLSAHADSNELTEWVSSLKKPPRGVFVVHGEKEAAETFGQQLAEHNGWNVTVPEYLDEAILD